MGAAGVRHDVWDASRLGLPRRDVLHAYTHGAVVWTAAHWESWLWNHPVDADPARAALGSYLDHLHDIVGYRRPAPPAVDAHVAVGRRAAHRHRSVTTWTAVEVHHDAVILLFWQLAYPPGYGHPYNGGNNPTGSRLGVSPRQFMTFRLQEPDRKMTSWAPWSQGRSIVQSSGAGQLIPSQAITGAGCLPYGVRTARIGTNRPQGCQTLSATRGDSILTLSYGIWI